MNFDELRHFYKDKKVLVTGHTGFKGSWIAIWLHEMGAEVTGIALNPLSDRDNFVFSGLERKISDIRADIRDRDKIQRIFNAVQPEIVFHLAAQPIVLQSYETPVETYETNVMGTIHVMEAIRASGSVKAGVMITTDKCYENFEKNYAYRETDPLGGYDPYSSSKGAAELAIASWRRSFNLPLASARAGNVVGGGDWAANRIIPDCIRAIETGNVIEIRSPQAIRPWQHVLEPLGGYLLLAKKMCEQPGIYNQAWNFGPENESVSTVWEVANRVIELYGEGCLNDASDSHQMHEANLLRLDIAKSKRELGWRPCLDMNETIRMTTDWYKRYQTEDVYQLCVEQIREYEHKF